MILNDMLSVIPITNNVELGTETRGTVFNADAYIEEMHEIVYGSTRSVVQGKEVRADYICFVPFDCAIKEGDKVTITKHRGSVITDPTEYEVVLVTSAASSIYNRKELVLCI